MKQDFILTGIIQKIREEIYKEENVLLSNEEIISIVDSQSKAIKFAIENRQDIKVDYLGKFIIKEGKRMYMKACDRAKELGLNEEETKEYLEQAKRNYLLNKGVKLKEDDGYDSDEEVA